MRLFKDTTGRDWSLSVDLIVRQEVLRATADRADLFGAVNGSFQAAIGADAWLLMDVLFAMVAKQAKELSIDHDAFVRLFDGEAIQNASERLMEAIADFFPKGRREMILAMTAKSREMETDLMAELMDRVQRMSVKDLLPPRSSGSASSAPGSSEPPPGGSASDSSGG